MVVEPYNLSDLRALDVMYTNLDASQSAIGAENLRCSTVGVGS